MTDNFKIKTFFTRKINKNGYLKTIQFYKLSSKINQTVKYKNN